MLTKEQRQLVDKLVEKSKNDRTIIVGSDIRSLSNIIEQQEKRLHELESTLSEVNNFIRFAVSQPSIPIPVEILEKMSDKMGSAVKQRG